MDKEKKTGTMDISRKNFIAGAATLGGAVLLHSLAGCKKEEKPAGGEKTPAGSSAAPQKVVVTGNPAGRILLKRGIIVDGTGKKSFIGDVLIDGNTIETVTTNDLAFPGKTIDCSGKVIAPGFIDMHSHNDWVLGLRNHSRYTSPFTAQIGLTARIS